MRAGSCLGGVRGVRIWCSNGGRLKVLAAFLLERAVGEPASGDGWIDGWMERQGDGLRACLVICLWLVYFNRIDRAW